MDPRIFDVLSEKLQELVIFDLQYRGYLSSLTKMDIREELMELQRIYILHRLDEILQEEMRDKLYRSYQYMAI